MVLTVYDWSVRSAFLHALISTDKRNPSVNAGGPVYGAEWSGGDLAVVDPAKNTAKLIPVPLPDESQRSKQILFSPQSQLFPSLYFGDELVWKDPINPGPIAMDGRGRVWVNVETRIGNADYCKKGSSNPYAMHSPREERGKGVDVYDPETGKFGFVDLCFQSTRNAFAYDKDNTLFFTVQRDGGIGWLNTRLWDETHDAEKSQGWCPAVIDYNGDGKIGEYTAWTEPPNPKLDREIFKPGAYGISINPVDGSVWYSNIQTMPGRLVRMVRGSNPPSTCLTEVYEVPYDPKGNGPGGSHDRGIDIDTNGVVWTPLTGEGYLASFDRSKCKTPPTGEAAATGKQCREGWSFYPIPGPDLQVRSHGEVGLQLLHVHRPLRFAGSRQECGDCGRRKLRFAHRISAGHQEVDQDEGALSDGLLLALLRRSCGRSKGRMEGTWRVGRERVQRFASDRGRREHPEPVGAFPDSARPTREVNGFTGN